MRRGQRKGITMEKRKVTNGEGRQRLGERRRDGVAGRLVLIVLRKEGKVCREFPRYGSTVL